MQPFAQQIQRRLSGDPASDIEIGGEVGSYRVVGRIGGGVFRAVHLHQPRRALLLVGPSGRWRETAIQMMRTSHLLAAIDHPGIAPMADRGLLPDGRPWLAMEVPSGVGLADLLSRRALGASETLALLHDIADVLAHAHAEGIVHRALTLRSIVLATGSHTYPLCIAEWGRELDDIGVYAAPEGRFGDGRVDVYALGVIAYRAATRRWPRGPVSSVPGVPAALEKLIVRMMSADLRKRPTAAEVRDRAHELLADLTPRPGTDVARAPQGPRFGKPRWTPPPFAITSEEVIEAFGEIQVPRS
jgi:serine/threonine protein kinase